MEGIQDIKFIPNIDKEERMRYFAESARNCVEGKADVPKVYVLQSCKAQKDRQDDGV